jgi:hypothetical protein
MIPLQSQIGGKEMAIINATAENFDELIKEEFSMLYFYNDST